ncbi:MAG: hypothetical protein AAB470_00405 [Patescibacteria group bacterium]
MIHKHNIQNQPDITINELAVEMRGGFKKVNESVEDLAKMTAREFRIVHDEIGEVKTVIREHGSRIRRTEHKLQLA